MKQPSLITIRGAREHNLKNLNLSLPRNNLVVITGLSGSGKSSLAFDTLYAEGYRKYMDSLSAKAKMMLDQIKKPDVDYIEGLSPVIAIEQHGLVHTNPRSTIATITEIADYARLLWSTQGIAHCPKDGSAITERSLRSCIEEVFAYPEGSKCMVLAPFFEGKVSVLMEELEALRQKGFSRICIDGAVSLIEDIHLKSYKGKTISAQIVIDRIVLASDQKSRVSDSLELAFVEGKGKALVRFLEANGKSEDLFFSQGLACKTCAQSYPALSPRQLSYNHPEGVCTCCDGLGKTLQFQPSLVVPDVTKTVADGAIKGLRVGSKVIMIRHKSLLKQLSKQIPFDLDTPWEKLSPEVQQVLLFGSDQVLDLKIARSKVKSQVFPGVLAVLEDLFKKTSSQAIRSRLMLFQSASICKACNGSRLNSYINGVTLGGLSFNEFMGLSLSQAQNFVQKLIDSGEYGPVLEALHGLKGRLGFLNEVGLSYLSLNREYSTLSGGESQRVRLATQLGMGLVGVLYVLDEPSIGLHPMDNKRLLNALLGLRDLGNTVVVVEHDDMIIKKADHIIELGPKAGTLGGHLVFEGTVKKAIESQSSITGAYLSGKKRIEKTTTKVHSNTWLTIKGAKENNLKNITAKFPVGLLTCVCGVSGSGKSTLVNDILAKAAAFTLNKAKAIPGKHTKIEGLECFERLICVTQDPIGRSPRSNPITFVKGFDVLREIFAQCPLSKVRGYTPSRFSFNVRGGRCERCQGDGMIKVDMQFLDDVFTECPSCEGKRYNRETLEVRFKGYTIADVLDMPVSQACEVFKSQPRLVKKLELLQAVGLDYLKLGQSATTLSGGEAQRIKLSLELSKSSREKALYILDEPTTGLHFEDIQKLLDLLFQLRDAGHTVIVIEHQIDVVRLADWVVELGPEGGINGGLVVFSGTPEALKKEKTPTSWALNL